ncbi:MAG TPA: radical SAM protein, partial [Clostridia bacterium]|nr:radical SAM protein [Clostridia bacterium]
MGSSKVFLFSTPLSLIPAPLLGVPVLRGYLAGSGVECDSSDINIRFIHWFLNDRKLLDRFAAEAVEGFKQIQQLSALTQQDTMNLLHSAARLSLIPPAIIAEDFGSEAVLGLSGPAAPKEAEYSENPWEGYMPCWATVLGMLGLVPNDFAGAISEAKAFENRQVSFNAFLSTPEMKTILRRAAACDVVGISTPFWLQQKEYAYRLAKEIRRLNPRAFIILGGSGLTIMAKYSLEEIQKSGVIDAVGLYQGELTLRMLAESMAKGEKLDGVPDLILFDHENRKYTRTEHLPTIHPDLLPTPIFDKDELEMYHELAKDVLPDKRVPLMISRGCYWDKCAFCSDSQCRHPETSPHEVRDPEKVLDDIEELQRLHGISYFYLITSAMSPSWGRRFAKGAVERGITAKFWTYTRALGERAADSTYFELLKKAGFDVITCGVESTVDHVLSAISKGNGRAEITNTIQGLSKAGVKTKFNLIADIPPSTYEDAKSNWDYIVENRAYINELSVFTFLLHLKSEMADNPEKFNIKVITEKDGSMR